MSEFQLERPDAVDAFRERHSKFFVGSEILEEAIQRALQRPLSTTENADAIIFFLGNRCAEDFREVSLLAAHGHS